MVNLIKKIKLKRDWAWIFQGIKYSKGHLKMDREEKVY